MKCPKCGSENDKESKFCKKCGSELSPKHGINKENDNSKKIIIAAVAVIIIALLAIGLYATGVFAPEVPLETKDFDIFSVDIPVDSNFVVKDSATTSSSGGGISYENKGKYDEEATFLIISTNSTYPEDDEYNLVENDGNTKIYECKKQDSTGTCCIATIDDDDGQLEIIGYDKNTIKRMAQTVEIKDTKKLHVKSKPLTDVSSSTKTQSSTSSSKSTPSSMSILGGSFSTGSADEDKTYASINVGTGHAGEDVIVQIWYSRDGNTLNNGNMVPATVHSDGYLEIASADAYKYYPDHATINIYDSNSHLLTTQSVSLSPTSGTQTF